MRTDISPTEFLKLASQTAEYFGFNQLDTFRKNLNGVDCSEELIANLNSTNEYIDDVGGKIYRGLATYLNEKLYALEGPILLYTLDTTTEPAIVFHIFNVSKSIAEAILIQTNRALATELGLTEQIIHINSLGDTDSITRYNRELTNFFRKRLDLLPVEAREHFKQNTFCTLQYLLATDHELSYQLPNPLEFLGDASRKHFRDIIEFFDMTDTPYEINPRLICNHEYYSEALFKLELTTPVETTTSLLIQGGRFDDFVFRSTKTKRSAVGAVAILKNQSSPSRLPKAKLNTPSVYIIQLGFGPKIRSLLLVDELRRAGIIVCQDLANDSLSAQLRDAENKLVSYVVIIGQKEYVEGTAIIRDMKARKQEAVPFEQLTKRIKRAIKPLTHK